MVQRNPANRERLLNAIRQPLASLPEGDTGESGECFCGAVKVEVSGEPEELDKGVDYLESRGVKVEPAEGDLVE